MTPPDRPSRGEPDLRIAGLRLWVHGRQTPDATDSWDGNWLHVTASCEYPRSTVRVKGPIIHAPEIARLLAGCEELHATLQGAAELAGIEPNLRARLVADRLGHIDVEIEITPDPLAESHRYTDRIDQSYLPPIIASCRRILDDYPIRDPDGSS